MPVTLLGLPSELLVHLCSFVEDSEHKHVRLSCKTLNRAVFDSWIDAHFTHRKVRINDYRARSLRRLRNLLVQEHLCRKLTLTLIIDTWRFDLNLALLHDVLLDVKKHRVKLRLKLENSMDERHHTESLAHCLLYEVLRIGRKVEAISTGRFTALEPDNLELSDHTAFTDMAKAISSIKYNMNLSCCNELNDDEELPRSGELALIRNAVHLKELSLKDFSFNNIPHSEEEQTAMLCSPYLLANPCTNLTALQLDCCVCYSADVITVVTKAQSTLQSFSAEICTFISNRPYDCIRIFQELQRCTNLHSLVLGGTGGLPEGQFEEYVPDHEGPHDDLIRLQIIFDGSNERRQSYEAATWTTVQKVHEALDVNVESWLRDASRYDLMPVSQSPFETSGTMH